MIYKIIMHKKTSILFITVQYSFLGLWKDSIIYVVQSIWQAVGLSKVLCKWYTWLLPNWNVASVTAEPNFQMLTYFNNQLWLVATMLDRSALEKFNSKYTVWYKTYINKDSRKIWFPLKTTLQCIFSRLKKP